MGFYKPDSALKFFQSKIRTCKGFVNQMAISASSPITSQRHKEMIAEVCFLQIVTSWERFLEDAFILYSIGKETNSGFSPNCEIQMPNRAKAFEHILPEKLPYAEWLDSATVCKRAKKYFKDGKPFTTYLDPNKDVLRDSSIIRNAVAHSSVHSEKKLSDVVKTHVGHTFDMSAGTLLLHRPKSTISSEPTVFDYFVGRLELLAEAIVP